jgi:hypothetical protein
VPTDYTLLVADRTLDIVGDPIVDWTSIDVTMRLNEPASGIFTIPGYPWVRELISDGRRIVVIRHTSPNPASLTGSVLMTGPIEQFLDERSDDGEYAGVGKLTVRFTDDMGQVAARQVYPNPALTPDTQDVDTWTYTGNAELALRELVNKNAGPGALTSRQIPGLALGGVSSVGSSVTVTAGRMAPLGEVARRIANNGGGLMFRTRLSGSQILFEVLQPPDLSGEVRFGFNYGNLKYIAYERTAPTVTAAIVGGQGETGADRFVTERVNTTDETVWGRYEKLISRPGTDLLADLQDEGDRALAEGASTVRIAASVVDTPTQMYGVHYDLGSMVAVEHQPGAQYIDVVKTVHLQAFATAGEIVSATVGSQAAQTSPFWMQRVQQIEERLGLLERSVVPSSP